MAVNKAWCTGTSALMDWFNDNAEQPYYSVWRGRNLSFSWNNDDLEAGRAKLQNDINFAEQNNVSEVLTIKLHPRKDKGFITDKTPTYASLDFRPAALETQAMYGVPVQGNNYQMDRILEKLNTLESRISANEAMGEVEDYDDAPQSPINAMLNNPDVQHALVSGILGLLGGLVAPSNTSAIAGVVEDGNDEAIMLLDQLMSKGVTVDHLRKLAQMSEGKLKGLLIML